MDFERINEILFALIGEVEKEIADLSPGIAWLERIGGKLNDVIVRFSLRLARDSAWRLAQRLAPLPPKEQEEPIHKRDLKTAELGREILAPGPFLWLGLLLIRIFESNDIRRNIEVLAGMTAPSLQHVEQQRLRRAGTSPEE